MQGSCTAAPMPFTFIRFLPIQIQNTPLTANIKTINQIFSTTVNSSIQNRFRSGKSS